MSSDEEEGAAPEDRGEGGPEPYPYGKYQGARDDQLDRHGFGRAFLPNNDIYEGFYQHGKRHGPGFYCFKGGARYQGEWKKGVKHGNGELLYPDGSKYIGEWKRDMKQGKGIYKYANGDSYEGTWYRNHRFGYGIYYYKCVNVTYTGNWKDGYMEGPGIIDYGCYKYHGKFEKNLPKGPGCFVFDNGKYMQHGFYVNIKNPAFDYIDAEKLALQDTVDDGDYLMYNRGIVPMWRARTVTGFIVDQLPAAPVDLPIIDSQQSIIDILDYLEHLDEGLKVGKGEEEGYHLTSPATEGIDIGGAGEKFATTQ